jgi:hypothetical protein
MTVLAINAAIKVIKARQTFSERKKSESKWPSVVQNRHTPKLMPAKTTNKRSAS